MSTSAQRSPSRTQNADLRAKLHSVREKPRFDKAPPAPKKIKNTSVDIANERAEKAERHSMQQHTTSLLTGKAGKAYVRKGERPQRSGTILGLMFQIIFVIALVVGVAYLIDPTILPPEWRAAAMDAIDRIKTHEAVRNLWPG